MSFDARSRERLEALGRRLPTRLPLPGEGSPAAVPSALPTAAPPSQGRHRLEQEQDPEQLFRELMAASPDGSVPPHHLERLRQLEQRRQPSPAAAPIDPPPGHASSPAPAGRRPSDSGIKAPIRRSQSRQQQRLSAEQQQAYTAFQQLLLETDD